MSSGVRRVPASGRMASCPGRVSTHGIVPSSELASGTRKIRAGKRVAKKAMKTTKQIMGGMAVILLASATMADVIYVKRNAIGANNGTSWANAFTNLQTALGSAVSGKTVWVAEGVYQPVAEAGGSGARFRTFQLKNGVGVFGGFAGNEDPSTFDLGTRDFTAQPTVLNGQGDNVFHVFRHVNLGLNNTAILDGFTLTGGNANGSGDDAHGGGMLNQGGSSTDGSSVMIVNCTFASNQGFDGGAVYNSRYCHPVITHSLFTNNVASNLGGAVYTTRNNPRFTFCIFSGNAARGEGSSSGGGALYVNTQDTAEGPVIGCCQFVGNTVSTTNARGGAVFNNVNPGTVTITNTLFSGNIGQYGAGIFNVAGSAVNASNSVIEINHCLFQVNEATYGGALFNDSHNTLLRNSEFRGNKALQHGGALYNRYGAMKVVNCLMAGGRAVNYGGAIYENNGAKTLIVNTTISGNFAERGGAIAGIRAC